MKFLFSMLEAFILITTILANGDGIEISNPFGQCQPNKTSCSDCYTTLKKFLLNSDTNVKKLSKAFFPPRNNTPKFVEVTYIFGNNPNKSMVWFWTADSSYLFFPIETFQFLSLFFGKPAAFFTQKVTLDLDEECSDVDNDTLTLLTQRLKNFIQRANIDPEIDDNYFARSQENGSKSNDILHPNSAEYILVFYIVGLALSFLIIMMVLIKYINTDRWDKKLKNLYHLNNANMYSQAKIFSVAITLLILNLYIVSLDCFALKEVTSKNTDIQEQEYIDSLPKLVFSVDVIGVILWLTPCILGLFSLTGYCFKERLYMFLAISTIGPTLSLLIHLPYILIAYLNDASYASSIFIYYVIVVFILFGVLDLSYSTCMGALKYRQDHPLRARDEDRHRVLGQEADDGCNPYPMFVCDKRGIIITFFIAIPMLTVLTVLLMGMITAALVVIPISKALSDAPNRLFGFYQVVIVLFGAYFMYKQLFNKKPSLESVVEDTDQNILDSTGQSWEDLSSDEKLKEFYSHIMTIVGKIDPENNNIKKRERQPTAGEEPVESQRQLLQTQTQLLQQLGQGQQQLLQVMQQLLEVQQHQTSVSSNEQGH